jgi:glycosyltransferase involved in cell wall biosynthesis
VDETAPDPVVPRPPWRDAELVSVVAPVFNEEGTLSEFHRRTVEMLEALGRDWELVLVDDGSTDATPAMLADIAEADSRVKAVILSRNFGHQAALSAGLDHATGDAVVMMDSDLQDPPELIPEMFEHWRGGSDVVYAVRTARAGETRLKLATAGWFYRTFSKLAQIELTQNAGDFRLLDRVALDALHAMPERNRFLRGMTVWVGFTQTAVPYERDARYAGETKYTPRKMIRFSLDAIFSFSQTPLQLALVLGFAIAAFAFLAVPVAIGFKIAGQFVSGVTTVLIAVLLLGGIQLITVGIIGEYLGRVYDEVKRRPLYLVKERTNVVEPVALGREDDDRRILRS